MLEFTKISENSYILKGEKNDMEYKIEPEGGKYRVTFRKYGLDLMGSGVFKSLSDSINWVTEYNNKQG